MSAGTVIPKDGKTVKDPGRGLFFNKKSRLVLADGSIFEGLAPQDQSGSFAGEVVFSTGMTGYVESLTDPSYSGQILTFTYPLIGNYGVADKSTWESEKIHATGVIVSQACLNFSHEGAQKSFQAWLKEQNIPLLTAVDTRALTKHLRTVGTTAGVITDQPADKTKVPTVTIPLVSIDEPQIYNPQHKKRVIVVDCGLKHNILRELMKYPLSIKRVPADYDYSQEDYDGVFISNGPGDPIDYVQAIATTKEALKGHKPVFGICLGSQLLGLAAGARTYKLLFGHRGHNQPCMDKDQKCYITSQNHGYALEEDSMPGDWRVTFRNLNDNSIEGLEHKERPFFGVQFHPEAHPGPTDTSWLFERFYESL